VSLTLEVEGLEARARAKSELTEITKASMDGTDVLEFGIAGTVSSDALEFQARCLDRTDIDAFFDRLVVVVTSAR
jgi:hypothetical protein